MIFLSNYAHCVSRADYASDCVIFMSYCNGDSGAREVHICVQYFEAIFACT